MAALQSFPHYARSAPRPAEKFSAARQTRRQLLGSPAANTSFPLVTWDAPALAHMYIYLMRRGGTWQFRGGDSMCALQIVSLFFVPLALF